MFTVWTISYNKDRSINNEVLEGEYADKAEALAKAGQVNGEVREYDALGIDYNVIQEA